MSVFAAANIAIMGMLCRLLVDWIDRPCSLEYSYRMIDEIRALRKRRWKMGSSWECTM